MDNNQKREAGELAFKKALDSEAEDPLRSVYFMKEALKLFRDAGDSKRVKDCKRITRRINTAAQGNFKQASATVSISNEKSKAFIDSFLSKNDPYRCLNQVAGAFLINYQQIRKTVEEAKEKFVFMQICSTTIFGEDGDILKGGNDPNYAHVMQQYQLEQGVIREFWMPRLFKALFKENKLNKEVVLSYLNRRGIWEPDNLNLVEVGLRRYFSRDYTAAMHILVPQFERFFLDISTKLGLDVITLVRGDVATEGGKLNSYMLRSDEWRREFGEDLCEQLNFVFCDPLGYALRHRVAHGNFSRKECNFNNCTLVIYFFIVLSTMLNKKE